MTFAIAPKYTIAYATVAYQEHCCEEHQTANGARFTFEEESNEIKDDEHDMGLH